MAAKELVEYVARSLVDEPDAVRVDVVEDAQGILLELHVAEGDMGKVIGRSGATAKAIRTILRVVGMKNDARVNLKIEEPEGSERSSGSTYERDTTVDDVINDLKSQ